MTKLEYNVYLDERKELYRYQQAEYDGFAKTLTALAGSFLAFSTAFLGYLSKALAPGEVASPLRSPKLLIGTVALFSISLVSVVLVFFVNARSFTVEIEKLEDALADIRALERPNSWRTVSLCIYGASTTTFVVGLLLLILFCKRNFLP